MSSQLKLDRIDVKILAELQRNGRITNVELAELVALSPSPCLMRVKKLQQAGYITGSVLAKGGRTRKSNHPTDKFILRRRKKKK